MLFADSRYRAGRGEQPTHHHCDREHGARAGSLRMVKAPFSRTSWGRRLGTTAGALSYLLAQASLLPTSDADLVEPSVNTP